MLVKKDIRKRKTAATKKNKSKKANTQLYTILGGVLLGVIVSASFFINKNTQESAIKTTKTAAKQKQKKTEKPQPTFEFYTMLPNMERMHQPEETKKLDLKEPNSTAYYLVQAGSFKSAKDADELKAKLLLNGFIAKSAKINLEDGSRWHRVYVGPIETELQAVEQQNKLKEIEINGTLLIKKTG